MKLPPVWGCKSTTPVKAKTSAPAPDLRTSCAALTRRGLVEAAHTGSRERGWRAAADVGAGQGQGSRAAEGRRGNRWGDSVGAWALRTREGLRSAERAQRGVMEWGGLDSGGVWPGRMRPFGRFKGRGLIAGLVHPHAIHDAHPDVGQGAHGHAVAFPFCSLALVVGQRPGFLPC